MIQNIYIDRCSLFSLYSRQQALAWPPHALYSPNSVCLQFVEISKADYLQTRDTAGGDSVPTHRRPTALWKSANRYEWVHTMSTHNLTCRPWISWTKIQANFWHKKMCNVTQLSLQPIHAAENRTKIVVPECNKNRKQAILMHLIAYWRSTTEISNCGLGAYDPHTLHISKVIGKCTALGREHSMKGLNDKSEALDNDALRPRPITDLKTNTLNAPIQMKERRRLYSLVHL